MTPTPPAPLPAPETLTRCPATPDGRLPPDEIGACEFCPGTAFCLGQVDECPPELEPLPAPSPATEPERLAAEVEKSRRSAEAAWGITPDGKPAAGKLRTLLAAYEDAGARAARDRCIGPLLRAQKARDELVAALDAVDAAPAPLPAAPRTDLPRVPYDPPAERCSHCRMWMPPSALDTLPDGTRLCADRLACMANDEQRAPLPAAPAPGCGVCGGHVYIATAPALPGDHSPVVRRCWEHRDVPAGLEPGPGVQEIAELYGAAPLPAVPTTTGLDPRVQRLYLSIRSGAWGPQQIAAYLTEWDVVAAGEAAARPPGTLPDEIEEAIQEYGGRAWGSIQRLEALNALRATLLRFLHPQPDPSEIVRSLMRDWPRFHRSDRPLPDHACASCCPGDSMLIPGFRCTYHLALDVVHEEALRDPQPPKET